MKKTILIISLVVLVIITIFIVMIYSLNKKEEPKPEVKNITNFQECAALGQSIMESYPRQCNFNGQTFIEDIGNELEKTDLIRTNNPRPNQKITSPLLVTGEARGYWFFEASFPVEIYDSNNNLLGIGVAQAQGEWMTTDFVSFSVTLQFSTSPTPTGTLILKRDNPSGLPENDDQLIIPVLF